MTPQNETAPKFLAFRPEYGFAQYNPDHGSISHTQQVEAAHEAEKSDWSDVLSGDLVRYVFIPAQISVDQMERQSIAMKAAYAKLEADCATMREALVAHLQVNPRGGIPPRRLDAAISWVENDAIVTKMVNAALATGSGKKLLEEVDELKKVVRASTLDAQELGRTVDESNAQLRQIFHRLYPLYRKHDLDGAQARLAALQHEQATGEGK